MLNIYLARHGQNVDNENGILNGHRDLPLTELGERQAAETAAHIKEAKLQFDAVYCSPLERAKHTAEIICTEIGQTPPAVHDDLIERDFGTMTGKPISSIKELCTDILETDVITYFLSAEGGESFDDAIKRAADLLQELQRTHKEGSVLLVTHGDMGKMLYAAYYELPWMNVLKNFHFGNCELILLSPDSPADQAHVFEQEQHNH
jgi:broad specificity phosphatase PhoE